MRAIIVGSEGGVPFQDRKPVSAKWSLLCLAVAAIALLLIFRKIPLHTLIETIQSMRMGWFLAAIVSYGIVFLPATWRWQLALRMNDSTVAWHSTLRYSIIGHFLYLILFGGLGGDTAKAALYARRFNFPVPKVLAAVSLDRLMGSVALILLTAFAFAIAALSGGFTYGKSFGVHPSAWWLLPLPIIFIALLLASKRFARESILNRFIAAFLKSGRRLVTSPKTILPGVICGLLMQVGLNGVLALNLQAVSHEPLPWAQLAWVFPVITIVSGLPITFAGIGARDGAAIILLAWCGVANADAEAMALLTLCVSVLWGLIGGIVLWCETNGPARRIVAETV
jgi:uncharacterized membrane protein YbhN (UPF0104 family)